MGSPLLFPAASAKASYYRRWTPDRGWFDAIDPVGFSIKDYDDAHPFTDVGQVEGRIMFAAYDLRTGCRLSEPCATRDLAAMAARAVLHARGREAYDKHVADTLAAREEANGR